MRSLLENPGTEVQAERDAKQEQRRARRELRQLRREVSTLRRMQSILHCLAGVEDERRLGGLVLDLASFVTQMRRGLLGQAVPSPAGSPTCRIRAAHGFAEEDEEGDREAEQAAAALRRILEETLGTGEPVFLTRASYNGRRLLSPAEILRLGAVASLPLRVSRRDEPLGVLLLNHPLRSRPFSPGEKSALHSFARHAALALARADWWGEYPGYTEAKEAFTRRYLLHALRAARWDLRTTSWATGLPMTRLMGLLIRLGIDVEKQVVS